MDPFNYPHHHLHDTGMLIEVSPISKTLPEQILATIANSYLSSQNKAFLNALSYHGQQAAPRTNLIVSEPCTNASGSSGPSA